MYSVRKNRIGIYLLLAFLLLALGLRLYRIDAQSLWNDEGTSVALSLRNCAAITQGAANDIHPPLYYYLLHVWMALFGSSEVAVRSLSAMLGTLLVLMTFALGRRLAGEAVGLLAAFLAALSPFQVYYSQETRMYMLSAFLGALSTLAFVRVLSRWDAESAVPALQRPLTRRWWACGAYVLSTVLFVYTHYFAVTVIVAQNAAFALWWLQRAHMHPTPVREAGNARPPVNRSVLLRWCALEASVAIAFLPWLILVAKQLRVWPAVSEPLHLATYAADVLRVFSLGLSVEARPGPALLGFAVLLALGILTPLLDRVQKRPGNTDVVVYSTCVLYLLVPIGLMYILSVRRPMYNPKFLLLCTPAFCLLLALGVSALARLIGRQWEPDPDAERSFPHAVTWPSSLLVLAAVSLLAVPAALSLRSYYSDPRYARDDYRAIAQYIQAVGHDADAIVINAPSQIETLSYYYHGKLTVYPLPRQRPLDPVQTEADLQQVVRGRSLIFAVLWATDESDPGRFVEGWLDQHAYKAMDSWYGNVRLAVYAVPTDPATSVVENALDVSLGDKVRLLGYNLSPQEVVPGGILRLTLFWQALAPMAERLKVFTHILDANGHLVGQRDAEPGGGAHITTIWKTGEQVVDNYGVPVLPGTPAGEYVVEIGMYNLNDGQRLPVVEDGRSVGDRVLLQRVRVLPAAAPPPVSVLGMKTIHNARWGRATLLGYSLSRLGLEHEPNAPMHAGDILHLTLFWQAEDVPLPDLKLTLRLIDSNGTVRLEQQSQPTEGLYPTTLWRAREIVRDQHNLPLSADLLPGRYNLQVTVQRSPGGESLGPLLTLTSITLQ